LVLCRHMSTRKDGEGKLEFYCWHFDRRIELDLLDRCQLCPKYAKS